MKSIFKFAFYPLRRLASALPLSETFAVLQDKVSVLK
jgi:hypothetical protein